MHAPAITLRSDHHLEGDVDTERLVTAPEAVIAFLGNMRRDVPGCMVMVPGWRDHAALSPHPGLPRETGSTTDRNIEN